MVVSADERMSRSRQRWLDSRAVPAGSVSAEILAFGKDFLRTLRSFDAEKLTDSQYDELELKIRGFANVYYAQ